MKKLSQNDLQIELSNDEIIQDYRLAVRSRYVSLVGRREVMSGKAKFGIFGDGKEVAQLAMAHAFQKEIFVLDITAIKHLCLLLKQLIPRSSLPNYMPMLMSKQNRRLLVEQ
jgi:hypothetical protein